MSLVSSFERCARALRITRAPLEVDLSVSSPTETPTTAITAYRTPVSGVYRLRRSLMREVRDIDLDYHIRHSALPHPGGQRELGVLVSRLHSHQLDLHRPLWEVHLIEGLEGNRFALYSKTHHSLIDGVSSMRLMMRSLSTNPKRRTPAFWTVGEGQRPRKAADSNGSGSLLGLPLEVLRGGASALAGLSRATLDLALAAV